MSSVSLDFRHSYEQRWSTTWTLDKVVCWCLTAALVFIMGADFRGDTGETFEVHWQIYLRLLMAFVSGVVGVVFMFPRTYRDFLGWPAILFSCLAGWYTLVLPMALNKSYSAAACASLIGVFVFIPSAMRLLGAFRFLLAIGAGLATFLIGSWFAYLFVPEIGVFKEQVTRTEVYERMGGLAHPNELGFYAAYTVLLFGGLGVSRRLSWFLAGAGMMLGAVTLFGCFSRTAMVVCAAGLIVTFQGYWRIRSNFVAGLLGMAVIGTAAFVALGSGQLDWAIEKGLKKITKTGSTDELATATGRTEIWEYGIGQISESPLFGYGYCSARFLMEDYSYHCHNIVLNAMMFGGVIAGFLVAAMALYLASKVIFDARPEIDGLAVCMLVGGMVEGLLGSPAPAASLIIWFTLLFWRQMGMELKPQLDNS